MREKKKFHLINDRKTFLLKFRFTDEEIQAKVDAYRNKLMGNNQNGNEPTAKDEHGRPM